MKSLYVKFVVMTIGIMISSGILAFFISNGYYQIKLKPFNDEKNTTIALDIATFLEEHPNIELDAYLNNVASVGYQFYLVDEEKVGSYYGEDFREQYLETSIIDTVLNGEIYHGIEEFPQQTFVTGFFANELANTIGVPITHNGTSYAMFIRPNIDLLFNEMHSLFAWILALTIVFSILLVLVSTKYLVKPITKLTKATKRLANGDFQVNLGTKRKDELGVLAQSFERMSYQLEQLDDMKNEFISNISHDIQSPLSNLKGYTNLLKKEDLEEQEKIEYIGVMDSEITRLSTLTKQLLLLASLDRKEAIVNMRTFDVADQLKGLIKSYQWMLDEKGIMISYSLPSTKIYGDPALLHTVWDNLLSNAIKYNYLNGSIDISLWVEEASMLIQVKDSGIGLNEKELNRIFDRFYRADLARTRTMEGTGLGLSIVRTIIALHNGDISVSSKEKEGTTFVISLPIDNQ
ncbi:sensor histidine kinase [Gracilibacillus marinus]|uniref:Heme sensor protein HssS n=1 Tax=Gracilibacillus marinus TaxID=630535 RepID=A0ABV8VUE3_9BACI